MLIAVLFVLVLCDDSAWAPLLRHGLDADKVELRRVDEEEKTARGLVGNWGMFAAIDLKPPCKLGTIDWKNSLSSVNVSCSTCTNSIEKLMLRVMQDHIVSEFEGMFEESACFFGHFSFK
jgi:hypothetical protein